MSHPSDLPPGRDSPLRGGDGGSQEERQGSPEAKPPFGDNWGHTPPSLRVKAQYDQELILCRWQSGNLRTMFTTKVNGLFFFSNENVIAEIMSLFL